MIGIVDYDSGNLRSVTNALDLLGADAMLCGAPKDLRSVEKIILPGVGAFQNCAGNLRRHGFEEVLNELVLVEKVPILGICVGMQLMARKSSEGGDCRGLGWFDSEVERMTLGPTRSRIQHVGWNEVQYRQNCPLFSGLPQNVDVYFVHSYSMICRSQDDVCAWCDYGGQVTAAVCKDNIVGTQFHPEKSQDIGLRILDNFLKWSPGLC